MNKKIGFIGFGNMAKALANGWLRTETVLGDQMYACAKDYQKLLSTCNSLGIHACENVVQLVKEVDIVIIAVKPYMIEEVIKPIKDMLNNKIVISVAAGFSFERYQSILREGTHYLCTIPNTPVSIGEGIIICENRHSLTESEWELVQVLCSKLGIVQMVDTSLLSISGTICGCGPAFVSMFLEALGDSAVKYGITRDIAYRLVSQMVAGTGKMQIMTGEHPGKMKDAVCSPAGTTIKGVSALEEYGFRSAVMKAIDAIEG